MRTISPAQSLACHKKKSGTRPLNHLPSSARLALKLSLEFLPLGLFFLASTKYGFWTSTAVLVVATAFSLALMRFMFRRLAIMAIITAVTSVGAGGVTLIWDDPIYVQMKPTIVGVIFALILLAALVRREPLFRVLLGQDLRLSDDGWRLLTWLWFGYFVFISLLNEFVWRNYSWEFWAMFKAFGLTPMTILYALPQMLLLKKYQLSETAAVIAAELVPGDAGAQSAARAK